MDRNRKIATTTMVLGALLAVILVAASVAPAVAHLSYQGIVPGSVSVTIKNKNTVKLSLTATDRIPRQTPDLVGFGWNYTSGPNDVYTITNHQGVRDSKQNKDGWHPHNMDLGSAPGADTDGVVATLCVTTVSDAPTAGIAINKAKVTVNVRNSTLTGVMPASPIAYAFDIVVDGDCPATAPSGLTLGIIVDDTEP